MLSHSDYFSVSARARGTAASVWASNLGSSRRVVGEEVGDRWIFPSTGRNARKKNVFPCITFFSPARHSRGDRLFFNFPFVCLSTLQIRATITTSLCVAVAWLSPDRRTIEREIRSCRAWFFAFCFLISSRRWVAFPLPLSLSLSPPSSLSFSLFIKQQMAFFSAFCLLAVSVIVTTSCKFIYTWWWCEAISDALSCNLSINNRILFYTYAFIFAHHTGVWRRRAHYTSQRKTIFIKRFPNKISFWTYFAIYKSRPFSLLLRNYYFKRNYEAHSIV